jgi:UDP-sulfoquinovose synthase
MVLAAAGRAGIGARIETLTDPRVEAESHYYKAAHRKLSDLGLRPHLLCEGLLQSILSVALANRDRINPETLRPTVDWRRASNPRDRSGNAAATRSQLVSCADELRV